MIKQALNNIRTSPCGGNYENLEEILKQDPESLYMNWHICMYGEAPIRGFWGYTEDFVFWKKMKESEIEKLPNLEKIIDIAKFSHATTDLSE